MTRGPSPSAQEIRQEMTAMLASEDFSASERNKRFLAYIVEETLAGRAERIKAYSIATDVFGRNQDFDPQQNPIVRIEAARLRRALENYYLKSRRASGVTITIPKGGYVPEFDSPYIEKDVPEAEGAPGDPEIAASPRLHVSTPHLFVETFEQIGDTDTPSNLGRTFTLLMISALARFTEIFVYGFDTSEEPSESVRSLRVDYRLSGTLVVSNEALRADFLLQSVADGRYVWAHSVERMLETGCEAPRVIGICSEIAGHVAGVLALRDGILDSQAWEFAGDAPQHFSGYQKLLKFQEYWRSLDPSLFEPLRQDLEAAIQSDPRFAAAYACLSLVYSNAARYGYDVASTNEPLDRAMELALIAIQLAPNSSRAYHARAVAEWFSGQPESSIETLKFARSLNPNDPELLAELGFRSAMRMDWHTAIPLIEEAYLRNPSQSGQYRMGFFFYHFAHDRFEMALRSISEIRAPGVAVVHIAAAAALVRMGRQEEARARLQIAEELTPELRNTLRCDLSSRQIHPELIELIASAIEDAHPGWSTHSRRRG